VTQNWRRCFVWINWKQ